jgi:hypothetical protein
MTTKVRGRSPQIVGAILFLIGIVICPVGCMSESQGGLGLGFAMVVIGGILYIVGKLQSA